MEETTFTPQTNDTIASVSSSMSDAGIGIIRISGPMALVAADKVTQRSVAEQAAGTIRFNRVLKEDGQVLDEALVSVMRAPCTYTGEDVCEINVHGSRLVLEHVLERLLSLRDEAGERLLRLAEPGEFTKRAFLNGKMDLTKAEAVQDLISARSRFAKENAARQLSGALEQEVRSLRATLLHDSAFLEAALDDPDTFEAELSSFPDTLGKHVEEACARITHLLATFEDGVRLKDGIACAIIGAPNTGKSTLLNALSGKELAIVTNTPGTTRDVIEETLQFGDLVLRIMDTAGIRNATDEAEAIGIARARARAKEAELVLIVAEAGSLPDEAFSALLSLLEEHQQAVLLLNKCDLLTKEQIAEAVTRYEQAAETSGHVPAEKRYILPCAFKTGEGLDALKETLRRLFLHGDLCAKEEFYLTNTRHKDALDTAAKALLRVKDSIENRQPEDLYLVDLMDAHHALGSVIGETTEEDLIEEIFSKFCLGK